MNFRYAGTVSILFMLASCATTPDASQPYISKSAFAATDIPQASGNGMMMIGLRAFGMDDRDRIDGSPQVITGIAVRNQGTEQTFNIFLTGDFAVSQLPPGTYC